MCTEPVTEFGMFVFENKQLVFMLCFEGIFAFSALIFFGFVEISKLIMFLFECIIVLLLTILRVIKVDFQLGNRLFHDNDSVAVVVLES